MRRGKEAGAVLREAVVALARSGAALDLPEGAEDSMSGPHQLNALC